MPIVAPAATAAPPRPAPYRPPPPAKPAVAPLEFVCPKTVGALLKVKFQLRPEWLRANVADVKNIEVFVSFPRYVNRGSPFSEDRKANPDMGLIQVRGSDMCGWRWTLVSCQYRKKFVIHEAKDKMGVVLELSLDIECGELPESESMLDLHVGMRTIYEDGGKSEVRHSQMSSNRIVSML